MQKVELGKDIYCVGAVDWNLRNFHGHVTLRGVTYNAYQIKDEMNVVKNDLSIKYRPQPERLRCEAFGLDLVQKMKQGL